MLNHHRRPLALEKKEVEAIGLKMFCKKFESHTTCSEIHVKQAFKDPFSCGHCTCFLHVDVRNRLEGC